MATELAGSAIILFDLDGTLIDIMPYHLAAVDRVMQRVWGIERLPAAVERQGSPQLETLRQGCRMLGLADDEIDWRLQEACALLAAETVSSLPSDLTPYLLPGALRLLQRLSADRAHLGLVTGTVGGTVAAVLERAGLARFFPVAATGDEASCREGLVRLAMDRAACIYGLERGRIAAVTVGDAAADIHAGKALGARTVGVATGGLSVAELRWLGADVVLESLEDDQNAFATIMSLAEGQPPHVDQGH